MLVYSESWDGIKRKYTFTWDKDTYSDQTELCKLIQLFGWEDEVFRLGASLADGAWEDQLKVPTTVEECDNYNILLTHNSDIICGVNEFAGWYLRVYNDDMGADAYLRIISHNAGDGTTPISFIVDLDLYGEYIYILDDAPIHIEWMPVKIDKSQGIATNKIGFIVDAPKPDTPWC